MNKAVTLLGLMVALPIPLYLYYSSTYYLSVEVTTVREACQTSSCSSGSARNKM
jgi:hypothetical protein